MLRLRRYLVDSIMYNNSQQKARIVVLHEHFMLLCGGDYIKALLLDRLVYYMQQHESLIDLLREEQAEGSLPQFAEKVNLDRLRGWIRRSASYLTDSLLIGESERTVARKLEELEKLNFVFRRSQKGKTNEYRPNLRYIEMELEKLGFRLDGNRVHKQVSELPEEVTQEEWWNDTPGNATGKELKELKREEWQEWAGRYKILDHAPVEIQKASWIISTRTGFVPEGKDWLASVTQLWIASGKDEEVLSLALDEGQALRMNPDKKFTFSGPRAYVSYAKDIASRKRLGTKENPIKVGQNKPNNEVIRVGRRSTNGAL